MASIQNYERGAIPKGDVVAKLALALECPTDWLLFGDKSEDEKMAMAPDPDYEILKDLMMLVHEIEIEEGLFIPGDVRAGLVTMMYRYAIQRGVQECKDDIKRFAGFLGKPKAAVAADKPGEYNGA